MATINYIRSTALREVTRYSAVTASDPLFDAVTTLLSVPLGQIYALAWRAGIISVS